MTSTVTAEQVGLLRRFVAKHAVGTATGEHWLDRVRPVAPELINLYSGLRQVRERVDHALALAVPLVSRGELVTEQTVLAFERALGAIDTAASPALRAVTREARQELTQATGKTLMQVFGSSKAT
jgi:hypothetical protein